MAQKNELDVTPEERRFLKRFFRREVAPWSAALLLISITAAWLMGGDAGVSALDARTAAALAQLRTENERLRGELGQLAARLPEGSAGDLERGLVAAQRDAAAIEARISEALEPRLARIEARIAEAGGKPASAAGASGEGEPTAWDVSGVLDRLYALEMRQQQANALGEARNRAAQSLDERLRRLEGERGGAPAAPAP